MAIIFIIIAMVLIVGGATFAFIQQNKNTKVPEEKDTSLSEEDNKEDSNYETSATLVAVGDALIHSAIYSSVYSNGTYDFNPILTEVKPVIEKYDLKGNLLFTYSSVKEAKKYNPTVFLPSTFFVVPPKRCFLYASASNRQGLFPQKRTHQFC